MDDDVHIKDQEEIDDGWRFSVSVGTGTTATRHAVTVEEEYWELFEDLFETPEDLVLASFDFLLERESKESILPSFDLQLITTYFPEYEEELRSRVH